jgi:hypothetical protein
MDDRIRSSDPAADNDRILVLKTAGSGSRSF